MRKRELIKGNEQLQRRVEDLLEDVAFHERQRACFMDDLGHLRRKSRDLEEALRELREVEKELEEKNEVGLEMAQRLDAIADLARPDHRGICITFRPDDFSDEEAETLNDLSDFVDAKAGEVKEAQQARLRMGQ